MLENLLKKWGGGGNKMSKMALVSLLNGDYRTKISDDSDIFPFVHLCHLIEKSFSCFSKVYKHKFKKIKRYVYQCRGYQPKITPPQHGYTAMDMQVLEQRDG